MQKKKTCMCWIRGLASCVFYDKVGGIWFGESMSEGLAFCFCFPFLFSMWHSRPHSTRILHTALDGWDTGLVLVCP